MASESSMADRREYVRVSVSLPMNPKLGIIDDPAVGWLYVVSLCHCGEYLTDGVFLASMVARKAGVAGDLGKRLVSADMWHEEGHDCPRCPQPPEGHHIVHDYLLHQRSKAQAGQVRTAGRTAAKARWSKRDANRMRTASEGHCGSDSDPHGDANRIRSASDPQCDSDTTPNAEVEVEVEKDTYSPSVGGSGGDASQQAAPPKEARKRGTRITADWTPGLAKRATLRNRFDRPDQWWRDESEKFVNWFIQKAGRDATSLDWDARFDVWIREAVRRESPTNGHSRPVSAQIARNSHFDDPNAKFGMPGSNA